MPKYFGKYVDFDTVSKKDGGILMGADNAIGDIYDVTLVMEDGEHKAWLDNRFGQRIGFLDTETSRKVGLLAADDMVIKAILSFLAFSNQPDEGHYWGGVALICYNPAYEQQFSVFIKNVASKIADDIRPKIDFDAQAVDKVIESGGEWVPTQTVTLPEGGKSMSILKRRRRATEKIIDQGRNKNIGCYIASWALILAFVALVVFGLKSCMGW